jgi:hypothetical protein
VQFPGEEGIVEMVRVAVPPVGPVIAAGAVAPKLRVGGSTAPVGLAERTAVRDTGPVKPPAGFMLMVDMLPVVAPEGTVTAVPLIVKP